MSAPHNPPIAGRASMLTVPIPGVFADDDDDDDSEDDHGLDDTDDDCAICRMLREGNADTQEHQLGDGSVAALTNMSSLDTATLDKIMSLMPSTDDLQLHPPRKIWPPSFQGSRKFKRK